VSADGPDASRFDPFISDHLSVTLRMEGSYYIPPLLRTLMASAFPPQSTVMMLDSFVWVNRLKSCGLSDRRWLYGMP
jgi:hypothetical protein